MSGTEVLECGVEDLVAELGAVVRAHALEVPAGVSQVASHAMRELRGEAHVGVSRCHVQFGPGERRRGVDRGVLPHDTLGAGEASDAETVELDELARMVDSM